MIAAPTALVRCLTITALTIAGLSGRLVRAQDPTATRSENAATQERRAGIEVTGRVVGEGRLPAHGVPVGVYVPGRRPLRAVTDKAGRFRIDASGVPLWDLFRGSVRALAGGGRAGGTPN